MPNPPKPDDRSDNVHRIQESLDDTMQNMREAEDFLRAHRGEMPEEREDAISQKQDRREEAVEGFRDEIKDEAGHSR